MTANGPNGINESKVQRQTEPSADQKWLATAVTIHWTGEPDGKFLESFGFTVLWLLAPFRSFGNIQLKGCQLIDKFGFEILKFGNETTHKWSLKCKGANSENPNIFFRRQNSGNATI